MAQAIAVDKISVGDALKQVVGADQTVNTPVGAGMYVALNAIGGMAVNALFAGVMLKHRKVSTRSILLSVALNVTLSAASLAFLKFGDN